MCISTHWCNLTPMLFPVCSSCKEQLINEKPMITSAPTVMVWKEPVLGLSWFPQAAGCLELWLVQWPCDQKRRGGKKLSPSTWRIRHHINKGQFWDTPWFNTIRGISRAYFYKLQSTSLHVPLLCTFHLSYLFTSAYDFFPFKGSLNIPEYATTSI